MAIERLVHFPPVAAALGFRDPRAVAKLCERFSIPVVRLNKRVNAIRESDYELLLAKLTETA